MTRFGLLFLFGAGCGAAPATPGPTAPAGPAPLSVGGRLEPREASTLEAPQNTFQVGGWRSHNSWINLADLAPEGSTVAEGDVVARFAFEFTQALPYVEREIARAEADAERSRAEVEADARALATEQSQRDLAVQRAALDLRRAGAVARRTLDSFALDHQLAEFEVESIRQRVAAQQSAAAAEAEFHRLDIARANAMRERYEAVRNRFELHAPHPGVVRYSFFGRLQRKVRKGDGVPSGTEILSISRSSDLSVVAFVPEPLVGRLQVGSHLTVLGPDDGEYPATVRRVDAVPQELGFLRQDDNLPNGREKAFAVRADLEGASPALTAGSDVDVRLPL